MDHEGAHEPTPIPLHPHFLLVLSKKAKSEVLPVACVRENQKKGKRLEQREKGQR